jgi:acetyl esterase/lipase
VTAPDLVLRYGAGSDALVDVHLPAFRTPAPLLVLVHGGFWRAAYDRTHTRPMADALRDLGYVVATPEYRRTGSGGGWPATFDDIASVRQQLPGLLAGAVPGRVAGDRTVLVGHSAGGHLALWWSLTGAGEPVVALAPVANLARAHADDLDGGAVAALLGGSPGEHPDRYAAADTARLLAASAAPPRVVVLHGTEDRQVPYVHSQGLAGVELVTLEGSGHFELIDPSSQQWPAVTRAVRRFTGPSVP